LVVDDEKHILRLVTFNLERAGFETLVAANAGEALRELDRGRPDLVILDLMLPDMDGLDLYREIRSREPELAIIMLTARGREIDRVVGLEIGADDYVTKPFSPRELVARVRAVLRRARRAQAPEAGRDEGLLMVGDLRIDVAARKAWVGKRQLELTLTEFEMLWCLARNAGHVLTREQLFRQVWGSDYLGDSRVVDVHISHLRHKLKADVDDPHCIETVRGVGYRLKGG